MKILRQSLGLTMALLLAFSLSAYGFQNIESHWSYSFLKQRMDKRASMEPPDSSQSLDSNITKKDLYLLLVADARIGEALKQTLHKNIIGESEGAEFLRRDEACEILAQVIDTTDGAVLRFADTEQILPDTMDGLKKLNYFNILDGYPDGYFRPQKLITRAEAIKLVALMDKIPDKYVKKDELNFAFNFGTSDPVTEILSPSETFAVTLADMFQPSSAPQADNGLLIGASSLASINPVAAADSVPHISISSVMGSKFRSVDLTISAYDDNSYPEIFYLALEKGSELPSTTDIKNYISGKKKTGLLNGKVVRGKLLAYQDDFKKTLTLYGGEGVKKISGETGFIDGYNYDIYAVGIDSKNQFSNIVSTKNVMAMPFDSFNQETQTYTIKNLSDEQIKLSYPDLQLNNKYNLESITRNARQLENIQRLADLYVETKGKHGDISFLTSPKKTYVLDDDIDLTNYMSFRGESGWTPIGNVDGNEQYVFQGSFDGGWHKISNLYIDRDFTLRGENTSIQGLFGKVKNATIRNLTLESPKIIVKGVSEDKNTYSYVGSVAGLAQDSVIDNITIDMLDMKAYSNSNKTINSVGGLVGYADNTDLSLITINNADITSKFSEKLYVLYSDFTGGVVGEFKDTSKGNLLNNIFVSGVINSSGVASGGVAGSIYCSAEKAHATYANNINSLVRIHGESLNTGGVAGQVDVSTKESKITFENCYASGVVEGSENVGGAFGYVNALEKSGFIAKKSASETDVQSNNINAVLGGFVAYASSGSYENCAAVGSTIKSRFQKVGGFVGYATGNTDYINCMSNKSIDANQEAGGFVGVTDGDIYFQNCSAQSSDINAQGLNVGGFLGMQSGGTVKFNECFASCDVNAQGNVGGFAGAIGLNNSKSEFLKCYSSGNIIGYGNTGSFIGKLETESEIYDCFNNGNVEVSGKKGSFIGNRQSNATKIGA